MYVCMYIYILKSSKVKYHLQQRSPCDDGVQRLCVGVGDVRAFRDLHHSTHRHHVARLSAIRLDVMKQIGLQSMGLLSRNMYCI